MLNWTLKATNDSFHSLCWNPCLEGYALIQSSLTRILTGPTEQQPEKCKKVKAYRCVGDLKTGRWDTSN